MATPARIITHDLPTVALVGRVNVGKSTLFNKITQTSQALVSKIPGTTRTRNIGIATWRGKNFRLIDTGGLTFSDSVLLEEDIIKQTEQALKEADMILFVVDIQENLLPQERELARLLIKKKSSKPVLLVANKADTNIFSQQRHNKEWLSLGFGEPMAVSAVTGSGVGDLLDQIYRILKTKKIRPKKIPEITPIKVAVMGKPNVGKSSLFNKLIGEERVIVSDLPHTTREPHDTLVEVEKEHILFIDTAGIRRKAKVSGELEKIGIQKSIATINRADIVLLILDATEPITDQDQQLAGLLKEHTRSVVIIVNKWDMAEANEDNFRNEVKELVYSKFPHLKFAPILFMSAKTGYRVHQVFPFIKKAWEARGTELSTEALYEFLQKATKKHHPVRGKGVRHPKILGLQQVGTYPPRFEIFIKSKTSLHISYVHYLENRLRETFDFFATPLVFKLTKLKRPL